MAAVSHARLGSTQRHYVGLTFQNYLIVNLIISPVTNYSERIEIISVSMKCSRE